MSTALPAAHLQAQPQLAALLFAFAHEPWREGAAAALEAARAPAALRAAADGAAAAALAADLRRALGLNTDVRVDFADPAHRAAVLPRPAFDALLRRIALVALAPALRRVIVRTQLTALDGTLNAADWRFVYGELPPWPGRPVPALAAPDGHDAALRAAAALVDALAATLDAQVGARLRLKLPQRDDAPAAHRPTDPAAARAVVAAALAALEPELLPAGWPPR